MTTTALFVEILIVGLQATAWMAGLILGFTGWPRAWKDVKDFLPLLSLGLLAVAYILGILVDRASDSAYGVTRRMLRRLRVLRRGEKPPAPVSLMRLYVMRESEGIAKFIDYQRTRVRIARGAIVNLLGATVVATLHAWLLGWKAFPPSSALLSGLLLAYLAFRAADRISQAHEDRLAEAYVMLTGKSILDEVVAAVCFRRTKTGLEFLLVRTSKDKYWTFPKGHIKKKERNKPWLAAQREATEESGATGDVRQLPIAFYRYPAKRKKYNRWDYRVGAYLLEATGSTGKHEKSREPTWCTPAQAKARLAEGGREARYAKEQQLVVDAAVEALGPPGP